METIRSANNFLFNKKVTAIQFKLIVEFFGSFIYYKTIYKSLQSKQLKTDEQFWIHSANCFLHSAIIQWCKIFGTNSNEVHWKKAVNKDHDNFQETFKTVILKNAEISVDEWNNYQNEMCTFRNNYSAHRHLSNLPKVPFLDKAFKVADTYFDFMHRKLPWFGEKDSKEIKMNL